MSFNTIKKVAFFILSLSLFDSYQFAGAQSLITGRVIDKETGKYIPNVTITKVGTDFKTATNALGFFQIEASDSTKLQLSCDDYVTADIIISGKENVKIEMKRRRFFQGAPLMEPPEFPGGMPAFFEYLQKNMNVPRGAPKGVVQVEVILDPEGNVIKDSVKIIQSLWPPCDREALRVMKKSPKWIPGENPHNMRVVVPIRFN